jgi:integrase
MSEQGIVVWVIKYRDRPHYMMRYVDPVTGRQHARSTGTNIKREAERLAAKWEEELRSGRYRRPSKTSWDDFRERYEKEKGASLAQNSLNATITAFNHVERVIAPDKLATLNASVISLFQSKLRADGMKDTTIATHLRHLRAALSWAVTVELLPKVPDLHMPQRPRGQTLMRGRPVTQAEFDAMLAKVSEVRPRDTDAWKHHLNGLWLSGLRLDESLHLSWDFDSLFAVDLGGRHPRFRIYAEAEKGRQDRLLPMTPDFADYLLKTPRHQRIGCVFKLKGIRTGEQMTSARAGRVISEIGELAGVLVNKAERKFATAHDLRRSFGTRWASRVKPATLQLLMRHRSIETTMKYYVCQNADDVADELWSEYGDASDNKAC